MVVNASRVAISRTPMGCELKLIRRTMTPRSHFLKLHDRTGGESVWSRRFADERFRDPVSRRGSYRNHLKQRAHSVSLSLFPLLSLSLSLSLCLCPCPCPCLWLWLFLFRSAPTLLVVFLLSPVSVDVGIG